MVLLMLDLYRQHESLFARAKQRKTVWLKIAYGMQEKGYEQMTWEGCEKKFRNLKGTFKSITDNNKATGRGKKKWPYFEIFQEIMGDKPAMNPTAVEVGVIDTTTVTHGGVSQTEEDEPGGTLSSAPGPSTRQNRKRHQPPHWFTDFASQVRDSEQRKIDVLKEMQEENKQQAALRLEVMKDLNKNIKSLLDKL